MKRILLFVATNVAVLAVIYLVHNILGVGSFVTADGTRLDLGALLAFSAVVGWLMVLAPIYVPSGNWLTCGAARRSCSGPSLQRPRQPRVTGA